MFAAFDDETWMWICITFAIAIVVILIISLTSNKVKDFVFGLGIRTPLLNLIDIFLNGGQNRVPGRTLARYLLTLFVSWSLIFRTCYQSKTFENLNSDMRHGRVRSIEELKEQNFTLVYYENEDFWVRNYSAG